jgi:hypothetical protein
MFRYYIYILIYIILFVWLKSTPENFGYLNFVCRTCGRGTDR